MIFSVSFHPSCFFLGDTLADTAGDISARPKRGGSRFSAVTQLSTLSGPDIDSHLGQTLVSREEFLHSPRRRSKHMSQKKQQDPKICISDIDEVVRNVLRCG